jgi:carbonic anhydrase/acetyltransferase-like protein (isoleucine patch superfamily)
MIGDEFGPFLIHVSANGIVQRVIETRMDGQVLMSPDHPALQVPASPAAGVPFRVRRSGGYEGMALTPDGQTLWALLEQPLFAANSDQSEGQFLRILEFSVPRMEWTGRTLLYRLEAGATAIVDFNFIDASNGITLSEGCQITNYVSVLTHSSHISIRLYGREYKGNDMIGYVKGSVSIGKFTFIGPHSVIMPGTKIGKGCIVSAYSMVKGEFPDFSIISGNPAKIVGDTRKLDAEFLNQHPELNVHYLSWAKN